MQLSNNMCLGRHLLVCGTTVAVSEYWRKDRQVSGIGRTPQFSSASENECTKTVRTDTKRARFDWL